MNKEIIKQIIIDTINGEEHLAENLKKQCIEYIEQLQQENKKYKEVFDKALDFIDCHFKEMVADEEAQELKSILKGVEE